MAKVLSTTSRLYLGVFGLLMFPVLSAAIIGFVLCFVAAPPVDIDGIRKPVAGSLLYGNNIVSGALSRYNMMPLALRTLRTQQTASRVYAAYLLLAKESAIDDFIPRFHDLAFLHFEWFGDSSWIGADASLNSGYVLGQEDETYSISAAHGYFGRLIFQFASFNNSRALHFFLAVWPVVGIWFTALGVSTMAFNLNGLNFNQSMLDTKGHVVNGWQDILNRADLGMEVMHERNAHNFPLDLA